MSRALPVALGLLVIATAAHPAPPAELSDVRLARHAGGVSVELRLSTLPRYQSELIDGPWRIVIDLEEAAYRWVSRPLVVGVDPVREIRGSQYRKGIVRLVIELTRRVPYSVEPWGGGLRVVLGAPPRAAPPPSGVPGAAATRQRPPPRPLELQGVVLRDGGPVAYIVAPGAARAEGYRVGDTVGSGVIETIDEHGVVLRTPSGRMELRLDVSKPPAAR